MVVGGPLEELELADEDRFQPNALGHLRLGEALPLSAALRLWQVREWTVLDLKSFELPEQLRTSSRGKAVASSGFAGM